jgi:hypothetical protein
MLPGLLFYVLGHLFEIRYSYPITGLDRSLGLLEIKLTKFLDIWHMQVVRLSPLHIYCLYVPGDTPGTHCC